MPLDLSDIRRMNRITNSHLVEPLSKPLECEVCTCPISYPESLQIKGLGYVVCQSFECRRIMAHKSSMTPLLFKTQAQFQKDIYQERRKKDKARQDYIDGAMAREREENEKILKFVLNENPSLSAEAVRIVEIPSGGHRLVSLSKARIKKYTEHLTNIISRAFEQSESLDVVFDQQKQTHEKLLDLEKRFAKNPLLRTMSDGVCSVCKGACCAEGKERAYLSSATIKRVLKQKPGLSVEDLLDRYLSTIANEVIDGACINQSARGCVLPMELRSDTCNSFHCESLKSFQKSIEENGDSSAALAIQRSRSLWGKHNDYYRNEVVNIAMVTETETLRQDVPMVYINNDDL